MENYNLPTYGLKFHDASVPIDSFWSYIFMFLEERNIKVEQNYIFSFDDFNRGKL